MRQCFIIIRPYIGDGNMLDTVGDVKGLSVYGPDGIYIGKVEDVIIDPSIRALTGLYIVNPSPVKAASNVLLKVPYRWVQSIGDIVILKTFPKYVDSAGKTVI